MFLYEFCKVFYLYSSSMLFDFFFILNMLIMYSPAFLRYQFFSVYCWILFYECMYISYTQHVLVLVFVCSWNCLHLISEVNSWPPAWTFHALPSLELNLSNPKFIASSFLINGFHKLLVHRSGEDNAKNTWTLSPYVTWMRRDVHAITELNLTTFQKNIHLKNVIEYIGEM